MTSSKDSTIEQLNQSSDDQAEKKVAGSAQLTTLAAAGRAGKHLTGPTTLHRYPYWLCKPLSQQLFD